MRTAAKFALIGVAVFALIAAPGAGAWSNYFGPGTFQQPALGGPDAAGSGWNNWTNNRVYRPIGHPFYLGYTNDSGPHWSTTNWGDNPFYFNAYGYSSLACLWEYYNDGSSSIYPVTCQGDI